MTAVILGAFAFWACIVLCAFISTFAGPALESRRLGAIAWFTLGAIVTATSFNFLPDACRDWRHRFDRAHEIHVTGGEESPRSWFYGKGYLILAEYEARDGKEIPKVSIIGVDNNNYIIFPFADGKMTIVQSPYSGPGDAHAIEVDFKSDR